MSELGLRVFGFLVGMFVLGAVWCSSRLLGGRGPWLSLVLFAGSPMVIRTINWIRPYGFGVAFILLALGLVWMVSMARGGWLTFVAASVAATLSVQCLFSNAILVLATCLGGSIVTLDRGDSRRTAAVLGVGLIAAISILPYMGHFIVAAEWMPILRYPLRTTEVGMLMADAVGLSSRPGRHVWLLLLVSLPVASTLMIGGQRQRVSDERRWLVQFSVTTLVTSGILTIAFLRAARVGPSPWHYAPWMAVAAVLLEAFYDQAIVSYRWRSVCRLAATGLLALVVIPTWRELSVRQTNVDLVADVLDRTVTKGDRIVVHPWQIGISFRHYYHGQAPWTTLPPISDLRIHRYDLPAR